MAMVQLVSYGFTTVENPLSDGGNFTVSTWVGAAAPRVPSSGLCEASTVGGGTSNEATWSGNVVQVGGTWPNDQYAEITVGVTPLSTNVHIVSPIIRMASPATRTYYIFNIAGTATNNVKLFKIVAGTATQLGSSVTQAVTVGDVVRLTATGSTITGLYNGSTLITATDSAITSGNPGLGVTESVAIADSGISLFAAGGNQAATPTFSQVGLSVTISSTTAGGTIFYTTNGSTPTHSSSSIANGGSITVSPGTVVQAFESASNFGDSAVGMYTATSGGGGGNASFMSLQLINALRGVRH